ncbi:MAG: FG-GAP repeat protein [Alphaproteobacteria bacterium]|nr:FG-GAP repeat protein [Alphaproteobacteria bacterium]
MNPGTLEVADDGVDNDCDSSVDEDLSGDDVDGDGYSELDGDCNDRDAAIYPGASETWYDGTDSDCDGASDYDADTDGFDSDSYGGDDCDDADAGVNPDAAETYYDGVDTNCDGRNDYDADGDGHGSVDYGGDDCDDLNSLISPSATEVWYDGTDQDCAGDDDYDADADGYQSDAYGGDDCDDNEASAYPGGSDTWYDGIDGDCAGDSDYDADLDGEDSDAYGGADCDDADAAINTSAEEYCDGVDTDCSGVDDDDYALDAATWYADSDGDGYGDAANTLGACDQPSGYTSDDTDCDDSDVSVSPGSAEVAYDMLDNDCSGAVDDAIVSDVQVYEVYGLSLNDALASSLLVTPDANGDSDPELFIGVELDDNGGSDAGLVSIFDADSISSSGSVSGGYSRIYGGAASDYFGHAMVYLGDIDQDSWAEIAVGAPYADPANPNAGAVYIFDLGPGTTHEVGSAVISGDAELHGEGISGQLGASLSVGDVDGDGLNDFGIGGPGEVSGRGRGLVLLGSDGYSSLSDFASDYASVKFKGPQNSTALGTAIDVSGDVTGNGYNDFIMCGGHNSSSAGRCWIVEGSASPSYGDSPIQNYDVANISGQASEELGLIPTALKVTDVDGDTQADILLGAPNANSGEGAVYVFLGGTGITGNLTTGTDEDIRIDGDGGLGQDIVVGEDIDLDGSNDLLLGAPTAGNLGEGAVYLLSGVLSAGTYTLPDDQAASWFGANAGDEFGTVISGVIDLEGDGQTEFAISAPGNDDQGSNKGMVYVVPTY